MEELNPIPRTDRTCATFPADPPDLKDLTVHGARLSFDCNTLAAVALNDGESTKGWGSPAKPQFRALPDCAVRKLVLNVTHACNLACKYCFAWDAAPQTMSVETACSAIDRLFAPNADIALAFFGGEPLLAWNTLSAVMEHAQFLAAARRVSAHFHVTTNGTLLDEAKIPVLKRRGASILLSMDGPAEIHNAWRPARNVNMDSHAASFAALERLRVAGMAQRVTIRATYPANDARLVERLRYFADLQDEGFIGGFSVEPAVMSEGCTVEPSDASDTSDSSDLPDEYRQAAIWFIERIRAGRPAGFFHFRKLLRRLLTRQVAGTECGAGCGYLTVGPDGSIFACHREKGTRIGHIRCGIDEELRAAWRDNRIYQHPACRSCWIRHVCGGGCRQILAERGRPLSETHAPRCEMMRLIVTECLWIMTQIDAETLRSAIGV